MHHLQSTIPSLFASMLKGRDEAHVEAGSDDVITASSSIVFKPLDTENHHEVVVSGRLKPEVCRQFRLPGKESDLLPNLKHAIQVVYERDFGRGVTIMGTAQLLKWWKTMSWDEK